LGQGQGPHSRRPRFNLPINNYNTQDEKERRRFVNEACRLPIPSILQRHPKEERKEQAFYAA
jgi:hypothetical protein